MSVLIFSAIATLLIVLLKLIVLFTRLKGINRNTHYYTRFGRHDNTPRVIIAEDMMQASKDTLLIAVVICVLAVVMTITIFE